MSYSTFFRFVVFVTSWLYAFNIFYLHEGEQGQLVSIFLGLFHGITEIKFLFIPMILSFFLQAFGYWKEHIGISWIGFFFWLIGCSIQIENTTGFDHNLILPTQFFFIGNLSLHSIYKEKFPIHFSYFFLSFHYFGSAITKLWESGLSWVDGVSLQLAVFAWGDPNDFFSSFLINNHWVSKFAQFSIISLELLFPLIFLKKSSLRFLLCGIMILFHFINELVFHYGFWPNIVFLFLCLIYDKMQEDHSPLPA